MEDHPPARKPRDARIVEAILKSMGVDSYDPRVVNQLLELLYRYVSSVLLDAREYCEHADKTEIDLEDIRLAIRSKCSFSFTQPPPRDVTMRLAAERNSIPLPPVDQRAGVALPPTDDQLTAQNYRVILDARNTEKSPHTSPKRPRLASTPGPNNPATPNSVKTPDRALGSARLSAARPAQSPARMSISSPAKPASGASELLQGKQSGTSLPSLDKQNTTKEVSPTHRSPVSGRSPAVLRSPVAGRSPAVQVSPAVRRMPEGIPSPIAGRSPGVVRSPASGRSPRVGGGLAAAGSPSSKGGPAMATNSQPPGRTADVVMVDVDPAPHATPGAKGNGTEKSGAGTALLTPEGSTGKPSCPPLTTPPK